MEAWRAEALKTHLEFLRRCRKRLLDELQHENAGTPTQRKAMLREVQQLATTIDRLERDLRKP